MKIFLYIIVVAVYFFITYHIFPLDVYHSGLNAIIGFFSPLIFMYILGTILMYLEKKGIITLPPPEESAPKPPPYHPPQPAPTKTQVVTPDSSKDSPTVDDLLSEIDSMDGLKFERFCSRMLRRLGYSNIQLTKSSGDHGVDIIATKDDIRFAFQCKCYSSNIGNTPIQEVHAGKSIYNCHVGVVITNRYFTSGAKELAKSTNTLLWDRDKLRTILQKIQDKNNHGEI